MVVGALKFTLKCTPQAGGEMANASPPAPYLFAVYTGNLAAGASANASVQVTENGKDLGTVKLANLTRGSTNVSLTGIVVPGNGQATALSLRIR